MFGCCGMQRTSLWRYSSRLVRWRPNQRGSLIGSPIPSAARGVSSMAGTDDGSLAALQSVPGVAPSKDPATKGFKFQQTMMRIKDPQRSLDFYTRVLGMNLITKLDFPTMKFSLYFLAYVDSVSDIPDDPKDRTEMCFGREATLELTHNWGSEESDWEAHSGNTEPKGFGHIGIEVPDVRAACKRFEELGVPFQKAPDGGSMKGLAFIRDPDGYWIEVLNCTKMRDYYNWAPSSE